MIVFEALVPHNPLLLSAEYHETENTHDALTAVSALLAQAEPDVIVVITEHTEHIGHAFSITASPQIQSSFKQFGIAQQQRYHIDTTLSSRIAHAARLEHVPLQQLHSEELDYGTAVIAHLLKLEQPLIVLGTSTAPHYEHFRYGEIVQDVLQQTNKRVAILIGGDCSHKHSVDTPAGFSENAAQFDTEFQALLAERSAATLVQLADRTKEADECVSRATALGFGIIKQFPTDTHVLSYEIVHGVGLMTALLFIG